MSQTNERAFDSYVELMLLNRGWHPGINAEWDVGCSAPTTAWVMASLLRRGSRLKTNAAG